MCHWIPLLSDQRDAASQLYAVLCDVEDALRNNEYIREMMDPKACISFEDFRGKVVLIDFQKLNVTDLDSLTNLYLTLAERNAQSLTRYGIDGTEVFTLSRQSVGADGSVTCPVEQR